MSEKAVLAWLVVLVALLGTAVYVNQDRLFPMIRPAPPPPAPTPAPKTTDRPGVVTVFGHEYDESLVRSWYGKVAGQYGWSSGAVYAVDTAGTEPMTYEYFVQALKKGYYFPELEGAGVRSDGERVILIQKRLSRKSWPHGSN